MKNLILTGSAFSLFVSLLGSSLASADVSTSSAQDCSQGNWIAEPTMDNGLFDGTLVSTCVLSGGQNIGIPALEKHFLASAESSTRVISGPTSEKYLGLDSEVLEVENQNDPLDITSTEHIAGDQKTHAIYANISQSV